MQSSPLQRVWQRPTSPGPTAPARRRARTLLAVGALAGCALLASAAGAAGAAGAASAPTQL
ncbi:MAG TPA: hypothetical protein VII41_10255, partial [Steroidobacteraceae bacterium]